MKNEFISASLVSRAADMIEFRRAVRLSFERVGPKLPRVIHAMYDQLDSYVQRFEAALPRTHDVRITVICKAEQVVSERELGRKRVCEERKRRQAERAAEQALFFGGDFA